MLKSVKNPHHIPQILQPLPQFVFLDFQNSPDKSTTKYDFDKRRLIWNKLDTEGIFFQFFQLPLEIPKFDRATVAMPQCGMWIHKKYMNCVIIITFAHIKVITKPPRPLPPTPRFRPPTPKWRSTASGQPRLSGTQLRFTSGQCKCWVLI